MNLQEAAARVREIDAEYAQVLRAARGTLGGKIREEWEKGVGFSTVAQRAGLSLEEAKKLYHEGAPR